MKFKKGYTALGKIPRSQAVYKDGIITVYYHNGSGISVKRIDAAAKTVTGGASTDKYYDWFAETPDRAIALKGSEIITY